jgi:thiol-disulfide isomerase/thioredoxin
MHSMRIAPFVVTLAVVVLVHAARCAPAASSPVRTKHRVVAAVAGVSTIKRAIAAQAGHVVVVNFWATWCVPCVAEFPSLVRLHDTYSGRGLVVMSVSADQGAQYVKRVNPFLATEKADFPSFILKPGDQQGAIDAFDPSWEGDLPRTFVYDKSGKLVKTLAGEQSYAAFVKAVRPLM